MNNHQPPYGAIKLLQSCCREDHIEEVLGDLEEKFEQTVKEKSQPNSIIGTKRSTIYGHLPSKNQGQYTQIK